MYDIDYMTIGDPHAYDDSFEKQIANDNCAVEAERTIINQFLPDSQHLSQEDAMYVSSSHGWYQPGCGTNPMHIGNMMDLNGIPNHTVMNATVADLAHELSQGHGVIVGVDSSELWHQGPLADLIHFIEDALGISSADHAIVVTGIDVTDPSEPYVIINDSGTGEAGVKYPMGKFMDAWQDAGFYYTATDNPMPKDNIFGDLDALDVAKWVGGIVVGGTVLVETGDPNLALKTGIAAGSLVEQYFENPEAITLI